jgi:CMP-N,N'-diacetyllegionaminic acid synthase
MRTLGIIPARGGSRGIRHKNIVPLGGRPLLAYTADAVRTSRALMRTVVSTDDEEIAEAARGLGLEVPFMRPQALAADDTPMLPVVRHALDVMAEQGFDADAVVLLQPTSPFRRATHIDGAIAMLETSGADSVVSVVDVPHQFNPVSVMRIDGDRLRPFFDAPTVTDRQTKPRVLARNGPAVLAVRAPVIRAGSLYGDDSRPMFMDPADSLDIDTPWDLTVAELLLGAQRAPVA